MRILTGLTLGTVLGVTASILTRRYVGAFLWWLFTADVRSPR